MPRRPWVASLHCPATRADGGQMTSAPSRLARAAAAHSLSGSRASALVREPVAHAVDREDVARRVRLGLQLSPDVLDVGIDRALV